LEQKCSGWIPNCKWRSNNNNRSKSIIVTTALIISYECGTPFCPRRFSIDGIPTTGDDAKSDTNSNDNADCTDKNNNNNKVLLFLLLLVAAGATSTRYRNKYSVPYFAVRLVPRQ
jgi:hypothetical protein